MPIEVNAPCSLPLAVVRLEAGGAVRTALLGITLQHPLVNLVAESATHLGVTGGRADLAYAQAERILAARPGLRPVTLEIEFAIPMDMGLGSEPMLAQSVAGALAVANGQPAAAARSLARHAGLRPEHALEQYGFEQGGVLLVESSGASPEPALLRRHVLSHSDDQAWAFALHLPPRPPAAALGLEAGRYSRLLQAAPLVSAESGALVASDLWPAMEADDLARFAAALSRLQDLTREALQQAGLEEPPAAAAQEVLDFMRRNGVVAAGESLTGLARWGLIRGARPSRDLRHVLTRHVGYANGTVMASICATSGAALGEASPARQP